MAVPKKRTGASAQGHRRSNWKATVPETTTCKNCSAIVLTHTVCPECGYYKGKVVSIKAEGYVSQTEAKAEVAEETKPKKTAKKTTKKVSEEVKTPVEAEKVEETPKAQEVEVKEETVLAEAEVADETKEEEKE